ncbi:MAG TPA: phosphoribosylanthranilate isomerase [Bryobacteraceae bacterium]|nr:phosphoribosylanthranilate isomerase [Bryobacteraceae bacterium]
MMVKICGITNRDDALAAVEAGASALGFNFYPKSPRYLSPQAAQAIVAELPPTVLKVGVFVDETNPAIQAILREAALDIAQVHGKQTVYGFRCWRARQVNSSFRCESLDDPAAEAFLLDAPSEELRGGTGRTFDWSKARIPGRRIVIAGGLDGDNVRQAIEQAEPWGVDACSRLESNPGKKDRLKMKQFIKAALSV